MNILYAEPAGCMGLPQNFGEWLRVNREMRGQSKRGLGKKAGISDAYVSFLESGQRQPSRETILDLAKALDVDPSDALLSMRFVPEQDGSDIQRTPDTEYLAAPEGYSELDEVGREDVQMVVEIAVQTARRKQAIRENIGIKVAGEDDRKDAK